MTAPKIHIIPTTPQAPKNQGAVAVLKEALEVAEANPDTTNTLVLIKVNGSYIRYSTNIDSPMEVIAQFELGKMDLVLQMAGLVGDGE